MSSLYLLIKASAVPLCLWPEKEETIIYNNIQFPWHYSHLYLLPLPPPSGLEAYLSKALGNYQGPSCASDLIHKALLAMWIALHELLECQPKNSSSLISIEMASLLCRLGIIYGKGFSAENRGPAGNALLFIHKEIQFEKGLRNGAFKAMRWTSPGLTTKASLRCRADKQQNSTTEAQNGLGWKGP